MVCRRVGWSRGPACQHLQRVRQARQQRRRREHLAAGGRQLDRERQPVEAGADRGDVGGVVVAQGEPRTDGAGPLLEERHRLRVAGRALVLALHREGHQRVLLLAGDVERHAAGDEQLQAGADRQEPGHLRRGRHHLLEVVEDEERPLAPQGEAQPVQGRVPPRVPRPQRLGDGVDDEPRIQDGGERDESDPVGEVRRQVPRQPHREAGLAHPAGSGHRQEAHLGVAQQRGRGRQFPLAPDERRQGLRRHGEGQRLERPAEAGDGAPMHGVGHHL